MLLATHDKIVQHDVICLGDSMWQNENVTKCNNCSLKATVGDLLPPLQLLIKMALMGSYVIVTLWAVHCALHLLGDILGHNSMHTSSSVYYDNLSTGGIVSLARCMKFCIAVHIVLIEYKFSQSSHWVSFNCTLYMPDEYN